MIIRVQQNTSFPDGLIVKVEREFTVDFLPPIGYLFGTGSSTSGVVAGGAMYITPDGPTYIVVLETQTANSFVPPEFVEAMYKEKGWSVSRVGGEGL